MRSVGRIFPGKSTSRHALVLAFLVWTGVGSAGANEMSPPEDMNAPAGWDQESFSERVDSTRLSPSSVLAQGLLVFYQKVISPANPQRCPMNPSCSQFARESFASYGFFTATAMTCDRLIRCGHDPRFYPDPERPEWGIPDAAK